MTSSKRTADCLDHFEYPDDCDDTFSSQPYSSQQSQSFDDSSEPQLDVGGRDWNHVWNELIGDPNCDSAIGNVEEGDPQTHTLFPDIHNVQDDIESWFAKDLGITSFGDGDDLRLDLEDTVGQPQNDFNRCYGMIYRAKARLQGTMSEVSRCLRENVPRARTHFILDIICADDELCVCIPGGMRIATLNLHLTESLLEHVKAQKVRLEALIHRRTIFDDIGQATRAREAFTYININVYGTEESQSSIGHDFSVKKIWLQRPDWVSPNSTYDNPHVLKLATAKQQSQLEIPDQLEQTTRTWGFKDSVDQMYSMLTRDSHLKGLAGDARLRTPLLQHQEKALDFMIQRETGPVPEQFQLWQATTVESELWYRHKITGTKSRTLPAEAGGGILADEMGMGKTYSMLAVIVRTLDEATRWSEDPDVHIVEEILPTKRPSRATLVVVPSPLLLPTWEKEIRDRVSIGLKILKYHGSTRTNDPRVIADNDIVLTTYHTIVADKHRSNPATEVAWYRIVLDEAHFIRRHSTFLHKGVAELDAKFRWCLTGTPIQNTLDDIGSLFAFIKIYPFDRLGVFRKHITAPFDDGGIRRLEGQQNLVQLFDSICIRRTKDHLNLALPVETIHPIQLSLEERAQYKKTKEDMKRALQHLVGASESRSRFSMFQAQLQLRLLCNHGTFQHQFHWAKSRNTRDAREDALNSAGTDGEVKCSACEQTVHAVLTNRPSGMSDKCAHILCSECKEGTGDSCPVCEATLRPLKYQRPTEIGIPQSRLHQGDLRSEGYSSKMVALAKDLRGAAAVGDKSIVFSCWTTTLDLIGQHLKVCGVTFERIDGEHSVEHRQDVLARFEADPLVPVLIMTTGVGAFGLSIIAANRVFLVEPQWNPSVEAQAIGRTIRIGQQKAVLVTRYVVENSVEEDIRQLQRRKQGIAKMTSKDMKLADTYIKPEYTAFN
ncbi:Helicase conserved domain-containing protein [Cladophialophora immunda]|nr:Helicase conserved domain-containing protein [Cladophialophora immunda]